MSLHDVADWAGIRYGTVDLITWRVIIAVLDTNLRAHHIRWPIGEERESAKQWVEDQTCSAFWDRWSHGIWLMEPLCIPIFEKSHYFGKSFYDRKARYSINAQIINTLNRQIIDHATGFNRSLLDTYCFGFIRLSKHHKDLLPNREWCWGDVGYPLQFKLMIPYKILNRIKEHILFQGYKFEVSMQSDT